MENSSIPHLLNKDEPVFRELALLIHYQLFLLLWYHYGRDTATIDLLHVYII